MSQEEDYTALPLAERAVHKVWKVRLEAYQEIKRSVAATASEADPVFRPFLDSPALAKKMVTDSNVVAQETALDALCAVLEFGGPAVCTRTRSTVVAAMAEKSLGSARAGTKKNAVELLMWYVELDTAEPVIEELLPLLSHRMPKLVAGTVAAIKDIYQAFGARTVSPKPLIPHLSGLFAHADKNVRAEASALVVVLYQWLGAALANLLLPELKPVQQKELQEQFDSLPKESPQQTRFLLSQKSAMNSNRAGSTEGSESAEPAAEAPEQEEIDLTDPVDVLSKIPHDLNERVASSKWKDRKEALEELSTILGQPKIVADDFSDLCRMLAKCFKDVNVQVVIAAAACVQALATGLRQSFTRFQPIVVAPMLERCKEKKASVIDALANALDAVFRASSNVALTSDLLDPILEHLKHKTPQVKLETAKFAVRCIATVKTCLRPPELKALAEASVVLLSDTQEPVRTAGAEILGHLIKMAGPRPINPYMDAIDDIKKARIEDVVANATVVAKPENPKQAAAVVPAPTTTPARSRPKTASSQTTTTNVKRAPAAASTTSTASKLAPPTRQLLSRKRLANSPIKSPAPVREITRDREISRNPLPALKPASGHPGLTGRFLGRSQAQAPASVPQSSAPALVSAPTNTAALDAANAKVAELEMEVQQLQAAKSDWLRERESLQWQVQQETAEKTRLMQEINDLQMRNARLVEDHTRDILSIKSRETQLSRAMSESDTNKMKVSKLERQIEDLRIQLGGQLSVSKRGSSNETSNGLRVLSTSSLSPGGDSASGEPSTTSRHRRTADGTHSISSVRRSIDFSVQPTSTRGHRDLSDEAQRLAELGSPVPRASSKPRPLSLMDYKSTSTQDAALGTRQDLVGSSTSTSNSMDDWKRAVEITNTLKARIDAMKQNQKPRS